MTEQQTPDREKKIAEIREALEAAKQYDFTSFDNIMQPVYVVCSNAPEWLRFLLDELERLEREYAEERAAHNAHVTEQYNEFIKSWEKYQQDKEKMIEGLHNYMKELDRRGQKAYQNSVIDSDHHQLGMAEAYEVAERRLRDILKEIGVTVR